MGSKKTGEGLEKVYAATGIWVDRALRDRRFTIHTGQVDLVEPVAWGTAEAVLGQTR